jgi:curli biogenesis system outer membrane secretion channel CsgG
MLNVVRALVSRDTLILAKWVVEQVAAGRVRGIAVALRLVDGTDEVVFSGAYHTRAANAIAAAGKMYWVASSRAQGSDR